LLPITTLTQSSQTQVILLRTAPSSNAEAGGGVSNVSNVLNVSNADAGGGVWSRGFGLCCAALAEDHADSARLFYFLLVGPGE